MNAQTDLEDNRRTHSRALEEELARVMEEYIAEVEAGRPVDPESLVARHSSIAEPLRACLATLDFVRRAASSLSHRTPSAAAETAAGTDLPFPAATQLGDFRLLREIGRGGMGVVYEAEQVSLGRRVALKILPFAAVLDPRQLQRFRNEAQAAAHLHHTNIVPVFAVGCERGVHYYAMQYIEGRTLADVIHELRVQTGLEAASEAAGSGPSSSTARSSLNLSPSDSTRSRAFFRAAAGLGVQAAEALEHAHAMGVVHRDVKPSNLLLDARGNLWVADFGLAKFEGAPGVTLSGDLLGTLRYMSPEQALARRVVIDHRSDVYSLGVTELARRARELAQGSPPGPDHELAASMLCASGRLAAGDAALEEVRRAALAGALADEALELLVAAGAAGGLLDPRNLKEDPELEPLRSREEFQRIIARLEESERGK